MPFETSPMPEGEDMSPFESGIRIIGEERIRPKAGEYQARTITHIWCARGGKRKTSLLVVMSTRMVTLVLGILGTGVLTFLVLTLLVRALTGFASTYSSATRKVKATDEETYFDGLG